MGGMYKEQNCRDQRRESQNKSSGIRPQLPVVSQDHMFIVVLHYRKRKCPKSVLPQISYKLTMDWNHNIKHEIRNLKGKIEEV